MSKISNFQGYRRSHASIGKDPILLELGDKIRLHVFLLE